MNVENSLELKQFIVFKIGNEEYGIDTKKIITIDKMRTITRVPKTVHYLKGVINLRGDIIPVMDLRTRFSQPEAEPTDDTRIIIVKIDDIQLGIIVDAVAEVINLDEDSIENVKNFSNDTSLDYILGVGKIGNRIVTLLNIEKLVISESEET